MNKLTLAVVAAATLLGAGAASAQGVQFGIGPGGAGVGIENFDAVGIRSSSFSQTGIVAAIGIDVISITKIAIE